MKKKLDSFNKNLGNNISTKHKRVLSTNITAIHSRHVNQIKVVYEYLQIRAATASMISKATGVPHKNICRYKRLLERSGKLSQLVRSKCKLTGSKAWYLTTNPRMVKFNKQLKLF